MEFLMIVMLLAILFFMMKNIAARSEFNRLKADAVVVHEDHRRWIRVCRILCGVLAAGVAGIIIWFLSQGQVQFVETNLFGWLSMFLALLFFAVTPYNMQDWLITEKGIFIYNMGEMISWGQVITTGIQEHKKRPRLVIQIKKEQGEILKQRYQMMGVVSTEEAKQISDLIREFIHALDRKKIYKRTMEEHNTELKKRRWF